jgi:hypothetical protein
MPFDEEKMTNKLKMTRGEFLLGAGLAAAGVTSLHSGCAPQEGRDNKAQELQTKLSSLKSNSISPEKGNFSLSPLAGIASSPTALAPIFTHLSSNPNEQVRVSWNKKANKVSIQVNIQNVNDLPRIKNSSSNPNKTSALSFPTFEKTSNPVYQLWLISREAVGYTTLYYDKRTQKLMEGRNQPRNANSVSLPVYKMVSSPIYRPTRNGRLVINWVIPYNDPTQSGHDFVYGSRNLGSNKDVCCMIRVPQMPQTHPLSFEHFLKGNGFALDMSFKPYPKPVPPLTCFSGQPNILG